jgi:hypothetical protein
MTVATRRTDGQPSGRGRVPPPCLAIAAQLCPESCTWAAGEARLPGFRLAEDSSRPLLRDGAVYRRLDGVLVGRQGPGRGHAGGNG